MGKWVWVTAGYSDKRKTNWVPAHWEEIKYRNWTFVSKNMCKVYDKDGKRTHRGHYHSFDATDVWTLRSEKMADRPWTPRFLSPEAGERPAGFPAAPEAGERPAAPPSPVKLFPAAHGKLHVTEASPGGSYMPGAAGAAATATEGPLAAPEAAPKLVLPKRFLTGPIVLPSKKSKSTQWHQSTSAQL